MKYTLFGLYCIAIVALLIRAEVSTLPLLEKDLSFQELHSPVHGATLTYDLSLRETRQPQSTYRGNATRSGLAISSGDHFKAFQLKWQVPQLNNGIHRASKSSPAADEKGFYVADDTGFLRAYDWTGSLRWQFYTGVSSRGIHSTPLTDEDSVYVGDYSGYLYSLNKDTGAIRWITKTGVTIGSSPFMKDGILYVGIELAKPDGYLLAISAREGKWLWTSPLIGNHPHSSPTLGLPQGLILMGSNTGAMQGYELKNGKAKWSFATGSDIKCAALIHGDRAYFSSWDGFIYAVKADSGALIWKTELDKGGSMSCPSINADGTILAITGFMKNFVLETSHGKILWEKGIAGRASRAQASPLIISYAHQEVAVMVCENRKVCVYDLKSSKELQSLTLTGDFSASPVYFKNQLFVATTGPDGLLVFTQ
ncbi:outer membrane protein assembly factor BamB family protein [Bdellovibrio bacteriovorus]|uniref:Serine/threonine protein kinase n=1 Tax=Bdellovibrio bacteriovorus TaxID=959 RepID=A0A1Z3N637_BDEBC|nr:PQQ-binding-like beta-propeller repeat protein [Bdellovibrio bacteriovorus]ASD62952.1 serine/threonine protein kinase [Bdellovibrio bacteriovorus]